MNRCGCGSQHHQRVCCPAPRRRHRWLLGGLLLLLLGAVANCRTCWGRDKKPGATGGGPVPGSRPSDEGGAPSEKRDRPATGNPQTIPGTIYRKPDPMIYDQYFLMSQGLAVTWDNPDIHLERPPGTTVSPHALEAATTYEVIARVWNASQSAAAPQLPVRFSYLRFGIGGGRNDFAADVVNLPVKGAPGTPARAVAQWTTPPDPGHYCLQVELMWPAAEDANPGNNLGQLNTDVQVLHSPATFAVPVRNDDLHSARRIQLGIDAYQIPSLPSCDEQDPTRAGTRAAATVRTRHSVDRFPVPDGWAVQTEPAFLTLEPLEEQVVTVTVLAPEGFVGLQPFNLHAHDELGRLLGGVTLYVSDR